MTTYSNSTKNFAPAVIGILRGIEKSFFGELMQASFSAGLQALEVTINTPDAGRIVAESRHLVPENAFLGMGTVRNIDEVKIAKDAGAMFIVTPNLNTGVIEFAVKHDIPIVAGALTPTEVYTAWQAGADMIKVFPCSALGGPRYIVDLLGPFDDLKLAAVGGVTLENVEQYFAAGAASVGVSTALFGKRALKEKNLTLLTYNVNHFMERCNSVSTKMKTN
jgi:2-dehydro-3-deoxyphosphogluconate aldolase/(4S)-4-hydroxy-2-oxoglutarate aldolase